MITFSAFIRGPIRAPLGDYLTFTKESSGSNILQPAFIDKPNYKSISYARVRSSGQTTQGQVADLKEQGSILRCFPGKDQHKSQRERTISTDGSSQRT